MGPLDIALALVIAALVVGALWHMRKTHTSGGCGCGCAGCALPCDKRNE